MLYNYFKTAYRNIIRSKWFSLINVFGLASSLAIGMVVIAMKKDQQDYDRFHVQGNLIYRVISESREANATFATCPALLEEELMGQYPEIINSVKLRRAFGHDISFNDNTIFASGFYTSPSFFEIFNFKLKYGNTATALQAPFNLVLYEETAEKLGVNHPHFIGNSIEVKDMGTFTLTGIIEKNAERSHIYFDALTSYSTLASLLIQGHFKQTNYDNWLDQNNNYLYLLLDKNASITKLEQALAQISINKYPDEATRTHFHLQPLRDIAGKQLVNNLSIAVPDFVLYALSILALLILLTACFNYTNLTVAKSLTRGKEVGIRKVIGANRRQVFFQFLVESIVLAIVAFVLATALFDLLLIPQMKSLMIFEALNLRLENDWSSYFAFFIFSVLTGILAGILPSMYLSSFQPIKTLKSNASSRLFSKVGWRKALMGLQFMITILFFITAIVLFKQTKHLLYADYGFNQENIINISLKGQSFEKIKTILEKEPAISGIIGSSFALGMGGKVTDICKRTEEGEEIIFDKLHIDENFIDLMDIKLLAGRTIQANDPQDKSQVIINKTAVERLGWENPQQAIGQEMLINQPEGVIASTIIGVIDDIYNYLILTKAEPLFLTYEPAQIGIASLKIVGDQIPETITKIQQAWASAVPNTSLDYYFYKDELRRNLAPLTSAVKILGFLTFITMLIMSLGLLGLASYAAQTRKKEISIRKILGATRSRIVWTLSKGMLKTLGIALFLGLPLTVFFNNFWLQNIAYRISLNVFNVGLGALVLAALALVIVISQTFLLASRNPAETLKSE